MARSLFRGAPELSRLFIESPIQLISEFLSHSQFSVFLSDAIAAVPADAEDQIRCEKMAEALKALKSDRINLIEIEARRVMLMTDKTPDAMLRRLAEDPRFAAKEGLKAQRDEVARSLWAYLHAIALFEAAERAMQVRVYREHGTLYEAWSIDASIPLAAAGVDHDALSTEIAERLQHDDGCKVEAVDLPAENGESQDVLLAVTFFGAYASQKTVQPDKSTKLLYFRPPDEMLLVYSHARRRIEVCSRDRVERKIVANLFAADTLKHDISNKPLTQKTYNLSRFRNSLKLPIPDEEAHRVKRAGIIEVQVALGDWSRKVTLSVAPEDDIDAIARNVFGAIIPKAGGGYVTKVRFRIEHVDGRGRKGNRIRGIVFVPQDVRFPYFGCHVVLSLRDHVDADTGMIDADAVRSSYEAAIDPAARGAAVHFRRQDDGAAQITVPGQDPWIVTGAKKVKLFERLYIAHRDREGGVKLAVLKTYAGFSQLPQLFGDEWDEVNNRYLYSPRHGHWALCEEPISV